MSTGDLFDVKLKELRNVLSDKILHELIWPQTASKLIEVCDLQEVTLTLLTDLQSDSQLFEEV